jgi:hypothetical protein
MMFAIMLVGSRDCIIIGRENSRKQCFWEVFVIVANINSPKAYDGMLGLFNYHKMKLETWPCIFYIAFLFFLYKSLICANA